MADLATPDFLSSLKALYPPDTPNAPSHLWTVVAAVAFSASNAPNAVPAIFSYALDDLVASQHAAATAGDAAREEQLVLARKVREAVLQSGLLSGMPRVSAAIPSLSAVFWLPSRICVCIRTHTSPPVRDTQSCARAPRCSSTRSHVCRRRCCHAIAYAWRAGAPRLANSQLCARSVHHLHVASEG
ncbi:hypothetical protein BD309DRAFT_416376 [Dichomitus squalens]|nr:hypothetical protein BD309DRAFT_416376 [Dichomitus squalens]